MILTAESTNTVPRKNVVSVTGYVKPEIKQRLEEWAEEEQRNLSNLVAYVLTQALEAHEQSKKDSNP